mmetsp:Transcript_21410/g.41987  ORF Transcript_21410/g.41987 Transcript_21410/m.41987 type:complete len:425 (+) Transcript_21410:143-1417(+)|eukprot:CAMPEP_0171501426 /NCGR_PEP_ID=MMETSP0958-20121227/9552_1 /TAXON_ID=87120 /ORGANISM="Aurantiochytrium limacinum, Strain ATCCMYA-1381" /LENGTH=424 /DNA_ID=CAMNT_0012036241 /DNA_START=58 /DNA_END=1332 /DNA_ORIENTATION=-
MLNLVAVLVLAALGATTVAGFKYQSLSEQGKRAVHEIFRTTVQFYRAVVYFLRGGKYSECKEFGENKRALIHIFSLCLNFKIWSNESYREGTYQDDLRRNLRNVAIPGTGIPLSVFMYTKVTAYMMLFIVYPIACFVSAVRIGEKDMVRICDAYKGELLMPSNWFFYWRLNSVLAAWHAMVTKEEDYKLEDKLTFLQVAQDKDIGVTPFMDIPAIICKHRNEEGGLGYQFFSNAVCGGDWIIQEVLSNESPIKELLPSNAPLSTFRVITVSNPETQEVTPLTCVWRAGMAGAKTDHTAIFFDVDAEKGVFRDGARNPNWYKIGLPNKLLDTEHGITHHPDSKIKIEGAEIDGKAITEFAKRAHERMMPKIPISGWDVALTNKGMVMLECNLSCNFFLGKFDLDKYNEFADSYFKLLEKREAESK